MEYFKKAFSTFGCRCCFVEDSYTESKNAPDLNFQVEITSMTIPNLTSSSIKEPKLELVVVESETMQIGKIFHISSTGMQKSDRNICDNKVYVGSLYCENDKIINDILLPQNDKGVGKTHFLIEYKKNPTPGYYLKDLGEGMGTFIRINKPLLLKNNYIISFGESHLITFIDTMVTNKLTVKFINGPKTEEKYEYFPTDSPVRIGRMADCNIVFAESSFSRYHCHIFYANGWYIQDGDGQRTSTNGTWLYVEDYFHIYNQMLFKVGETLFRTDIK